MTAGDELYCYKRLIGAAAREPIARQAVLAGLIEAVVRRGCAGDIAQSLVMLDATGETGIGVLARAYHLDGIGQLTIDLRGLMAGRGPDGLPDKGEGA